MTTTQATWYFTCDVDSADKAFAKHTPFANFYEAYKGDDKRVEYVEDYIDEGGSRLAHVEWPRKEWPELTSQLFFKLMTECLQSNLRYCHCFGVKAHLKSDDGKDIASYLHQFDDHGKGDYAGRMWINRQEAEKDLADRLKQIAKIASDQEEGW